MAKSVGTARGKKIVPRSKAGQAASRAAATGAAESTTRKARKLSANANTTERRTRRLAANTSDSTRTTRAASH